MDTFETTRSRHRLCRAACVLTLPLLLGAYAQAFEQAQQAEPYDASEFAPEPGDIQPENAQGYAGEENPEEFAPPEADHEADHKEPIYSGVPVVGTPMLSNRPNAARDEVKVAPRTTAVRSAPVTNAAVDERLRRARVLSRRGEWAEAASQWRALLHDLRRAGSSVAPARAAALQAEATRELRRSQSHGSVFYRVPDVHVQVSLAAAPAAGSSRFFKVTLPKAVAKKAVAKLGARPITPFRVDQKTVAAATVLSRASTSTSAGRAPTRVVRNGGHGENGEPESQRLETQLLRRAGVRAGGSERQVAGTVAKNRVQNAVGMGKAQMSRLGMEAVIIASARLSPSRPLAILPAPVRLPSAVPVAPKLGRGRTWTMIFRLPGAVEAAQADARPLGS